MTHVDIEQPAALADWLRATGRVDAHEPLKSTILGGGVSNRTVLLSRSRGDDWVLKQALERLRVAVEWHCNPERVHREALGMRWLATLAPAGAICPMVFEDHEQHVVAMQAVPPPHANWKGLLLEGRVEADHVRQFGQILASIHRGSILASRRLSEVFADRSYFETLRLEPFYEYTASRVPEAAAFLETLAAETRRTRQALVHGDYSPKNILVHRGRLVLLDHEVIHWGDPAFDLGFALAHLLSKAHGLPRSRQALAGAAVLFWEHYQFAACPCLAGAEEQARVVRHALGCLLARVAGRSQVEYLDTEAKERQRRVVIPLMRSAPPTVASLSESFLLGIDS